MVSRTKGAEYCYIQQQKQTTKKSEEHTRAHACKQLLNEVLKRWRSGIFGN